MKTLLHTGAKVILCFSVVVLAACSSGGGGDSSTTSRAVINSSEDVGTASLTTLSGNVADGYLRDARVFLDRNGNRLYDNGEPTAQSGNGGLYSLEVNPGEGELYPVIVEVIAGQTVDEDTGVPVADSYLMEAPPGHWEFVSPITTLVKIERDKNLLFTEQQALLSVRSQFGIADEASLFTDYLATSGMAGPLLEEYGRTHKAARVIAHLLGRLRSEILLNLGGQIADGEQALVAYMISDQILGQAGIVKQALDDERNLGTTVDVVALTSAAMAEINIANLDADLLLLYQQRLDQNLEFWDMQPPQLLSQSPPPNDSAPVDAIVAMTFDELLDETLLSSSLIELSGPYGAVAGNLDYNAEQKLLSFTPSNWLLPFSTYQVTLSGQLSDSLGNHLVDDISWSFATIFDKTPPPLPDF
ncbi:MAG: Ig-like domain-containing protein [Deltaproteobacteria bacterium]|nr:Ig-like domain-containing protein [Deltaproteobacteria bacterium]